MLQGGKGFLEPGSSVARVAPQFNAKDLLPLHVGLTKGLCTPDTEETCAETRYAYKTVSNWSVAGLHQTC